MFSCITYQVFNEASVLLPKAYITYLLDIKMSPFILFIKERHMNYETQYLDEV